MHLAGTAGSPATTMSKIQPPVSLPQSSPCPLHVCFHLPRPWDITLRSHIQSILSGAPHLINSNLRIYLRPSYKTSDEALLILVGSHEDKVDYAVDHFVKSLLERGWAVRDPVDNTRHLRGYTNIYLHQRYTQRGVLGSTSRS